MLDLTVNPAKESKAFGEKQSFVSAKKKMTFGKISYTYIKESNIFVCSKCWFRTRDKSALVAHGKHHKRVIASKLYPCKECPFSSDSPKEIKKHKGLHNTYRNITFKCKICLFQTKGFEAIQSHVVTHDMAKQKKNKKPYVRIRLQNVIYLCDLCTFRTNLKNIILIHDTTHRKRTEPVYEDEVELSNNAVIQTKQKKSPKELLKCCKCPYEATKKSNLISHTKLHKIFKCMLCLFHTKVKRLMNQHMNSHKAYARVSYKCQACFFETKTPQLMQDHLLAHPQIQEEYFSDTNGNQILSNYLIYKCDVCPYETKIETLILDHKKNHLNLRCPICEYTTDTKQNMKKHLNNHEELRKFQCEICPFTTKYAVSLRGHMKIHEKAVVFYCDQCSYQAPRRFLINKHTASVHPRQTLKCTECAYETQRVDSYQTHMLGHKIIID